MSDDEYEESFNIERRTEALGFKPQKEILINTLLPYADQMDEESTKLFAQIKCNLGKAVMLRELKPGCGVWTAKLIKYLRLYGMKFSKEDHIALIKLVYELIMIPELEPGKVHKFSTLFVMLTSKRALISPEELVLPWRPLYELGKRLFHQSTMKIGLYYYFRDMDVDDTGSGLESLINMLRKLMSGSEFENIMSFGLSEMDNFDLSKSVETSYAALVKYAKPYFELSATKEILEELLSQFSPWSNDSHIANQLVAFLPVDLHPKHADVGHKLWLDKLLDIWDSCHNGHCIVGDLLPMFAYLAKRNPGIVDWTPQVPAMFTRFLRAFNLPVSYKDTHIGKNYTLDIKHIAMWIVWTISPDGVTLKHLRSFLAAVESYLHSANSGRWSFKLKDLLRKLAREFLNRVRRETRKVFKKSWENQTPQEYKLREQDITEFVQILIEPTLSAVFSRNGVGEVSLTLQNLATLRPAIVIPPLLEKFRSSLESLTEPHRVTAAMQAASAVARPMLQGSTLGYPEGPTHVVPLLMSSLPGLDPNDIKKTLVTLHFILVFSWMVPFIDCSSAYEYWPDLTEEELLTCESTAQFEDFILLYLGRIFAIIESSKMENVRHETKESDSIRSKMESITENSLFSSTTAALIQCSPKILEEAMRKFKAFAMNSTFETNVAGNMVGVILKVFARVNPNATLAAFVPQLCAEISELLEADESLQEEDNPPRELLYRLLLLAHAVECDGQSLPPYMPKILTVLDSALTIRNKEAYIMATDILKHMMTSFSTIELKEFRSCSKDYSKAPKEWLPIREWGRACSLKEANLKWHVPNKEEADCAQQLFDRYAKPEVEILKTWLAGDDTIDHKRRLRSFHILHAALACTNFLPAPEEDTIELVESLVPATSFALTSGINYFITLDGKNVRSEIIELLNLVQAKMLQVKSDDTKGFEKLIQLWDRVSGVRSNRSGIHLEARMRSYAALERALDGKGGPLGGGRIRTLLADAARLQDEARMDLQSDVGIGPAGLSILNALYELSINTYTSVRRLAQMRLNGLLSHYAYSYRILVPKLTSLLEAGGEGDEWHAKHKGALFIMLGSRMGPLVAKQDWSLIKTLWPTILKSPLSEKPSILRLEQSFHELLRHYFPTTNTKTKLSEGCVEAAAVLLNESEKSDPKFLSYFDTAEARELAVCDKNEALYYELVNELVSVAEAPNVHRRRLELAMHLLTFCPIKESPYPPNAIRLILASLIHNNITVRRMATTLLVFVLKQRKLKAKKIKMDPYEIAGVPKPKEYVPGYRKDLEWAMWSDAGIPKTDEEWDKPWLKSSDYGFYCWPQELMIAAPTNEQPSPNRTPEEMGEGERCIYEFFTDEEKINSLIKFLTVEEKKGKDKFSAVRFFMFKYLFKLFGEGITMKFLEHALKYASSTQEASQRFAAEITAAAVRAPRYWTRESAIRVYEQAVKVLKAGLTAITPETVEDWTVCVLVAVENQDPRRAATVFEAVVEHCLPAPAADADADADRESSFGVCARIHAFRGVLSTLSWRGAPLAAALLRRLCAANFIQHPYQNVRDSIVGLLMAIFNTELVFAGGQPGPAPRLADFIADIKPKLGPLYDNNGEIITHVGTGAGESSCPATAGTPPSMSEPDLTTGEALVSVAVARLSSLQPLSEEQAQQADDSNEPSEADPMVLLECAEKGLPAQLQAGLHLGGDSAAPGPRQHARALNLLTTVLRTCAGAMTLCVGGSAGAQYALAGAACALAARGPPQPHDEVARAADAFLASLALARHSPKTFDVALQHIEDIANTKSWWTRLACVSFAQPLLFYGLPFLCAEPARATRAEAFALSLMRDPRLEVRQAATKLLTGLMHCQALPDEDKTIKKLMKFSRSKEIVQRHCGVLGLCAYLASRPYSLGARIGAVLYELSKHTNAPDPIPSSIRTTLADFRRTHQDDWPKHREALTAEELDLLAELTSPPTYCA